ncbi:MAG: chorismate synthase [Thermoplasmata archaeon]|nr:MAG: chorismate synthase [Thermoplasmata archaeon]
MAGNTLGNIFRVTTWGESHGDAIGCVIDGCPAGIRLSRQHIKSELDRDVPYPLLTRRVEENNFQILSGVFEGYTIGTPISIIVRNSNVESEKYKKIMHTPRPGHADLTYRMKYGHIDWRGGSRASGRTWVSTIAAGAVAKRICLLKKIAIKSTMLELGGVKVDNNNLEQIIEKLAEQSKRDSDTTGGIIEIQIQNLPSGLGAPAFNRFQADLGHAILNIPGIKTFELGDGLDSARMRASEFNDPIVTQGGSVTTSSNRAGGVLGGITYGPPVVFRFAVKPTPSILIAQKSVDLRTMKNTKMATEGRFDANYTPRVLVVAEAVSAIVCADHLMLSGYVPQDSIIPRKDRLRYDFMNRRA